MSTQIKIGQLVIVGLDCPDIGVVIDYNNPEFNFDGQPCYVVWHADEALTVTYGQIIPLSED